MPKAQAVSGGGTGKRGARVGRVSPGEMLLRCGMLRGALGRLIFLQGLSGQSMSNWAWGRGRSEHEHGGDEAICQGKSEDLLVIEESEAAYR